jgi:hypothetical protein
MPKAERVNEVYCVVRTEEIIIRDEAYRLEVLHCVRNAGADPAALHDDAYRVRAYRERAIEVRARDADEPMVVTVWAHLRLEGTRAHRQEDQAIAEAHTALLAEARQPPK